VLNDKIPIPGDRVPDLPVRGRIGLQHHGSKQGEPWTGPPSLIQYKSIFINEFRL